MTLVAGWRFQERLFERDRIVYESVMSRNLPLVVTFGEGCGLHPHGIHHRFLISGVAFLSHPVDPIRILTLRPIPFHIEPLDDLLLLPDGIVRVFGIPFPIALFDKADRLVTAPDLPQDHVTFS